MTNTPNEQAYLKLLRLVDEGNGKSGSARILKVSPTAVNKKIKRLRKFGYILEDKRAYPHIVKLTSKGKIALRRKVLTLSGYVRERRGRPKARTPPAKGMIRLHNLQVLIPILKRGRPLPIKGKNELNNWTQYFLDLQAPVNATVELTTKNIKLYIHEIEVPRGYTGYLKLLSEITKTIFMVHSCLSQFGWIIDTLSIAMPTQHIATTMPEFDQENLQASEVYLDRKAKDLHGKENKQEARAWLDRSKGVLEIETNDMAYEESLIMMPENMNDLGRFARSHEQFMVTMATETLPELGKMLTKLNERLDKI